MPLRAAAVVLLLALTPAFLRAQAGLPEPVAQPRDSELPESVLRAERQTGGEVLRAESMQRDGREVYRLKVLTPDGRVRIMRDDPRERRRDAWRESRQNALRDPFAEPAGRPAEAFREPPSPPTGRFRELDSPAGRFREIDSPATERFRERVTPPVGFPPSRFEAPTAPEALPPSPPADLAVPETLPPVERGDRY